MRIALDAMGTDGAPATEITGVATALSELGPDVRILLVGEQGAIEDELARHPEIPADRVEVVHAPDVIAAGESPAQAVRRKPESSIVRGVRLQQEGKADAFVSAGSTGAVMAASLVLLRALSGVDRPPVGTLLPTSGSPALLVDSGANVDSRPEHLVQFARLGNIYAQNLMGLDRPRVGLLNIGEEAGKGNDLAQRTYPLLAESGLNFVGNVEGRDIIRSRADVVVCDGFVGNALLKFYESVAAFIIGLLKKELREQESGLDLERVLQVLDYAEYGGAPLLGVNGVTVICHGQSPPKAIRNALGVASQAVRSSMVERIAQELSGEQIKGEKP